MKLTTSLVASLVLVASAYAQAPIQRNPWTTNIIGNAVLGANNLIVTNTSAAGTNWVFYGVASNTVARLVDITNVTGNFVLKAGDTMTGSLTTLGHTNTGGFTNSGNAYVSGNVGIGTNGFLPILQVEGNRTGRAFAVNDTQLVVTNGNVGIGTAVPSSAIEVAGTITASGASSDIISGRDLRAAGSGSIFWLSRTRMSSGADGYLDMKQYSTPDFLGLRFGGTSAGNPALFTYTNVPGTTYTTYQTPHLQAKTASGSANIPIVALTFIADSTNSAAVGNARGQGAVDLQAYRSSATAVASGTNSFIGAGTNNTASGWNSAVVGGSGNTASGQNAFIGGGSGNVSGTGTATVAFGLDCTASGSYSMASGLRASAPRYGQFARASGYFSAQGDAEMVIFTARAVLTLASTTSTNLWLDGSASLIEIPSNTSWIFKAQIVGRTTDAGTGDEESGAYTIEGLIERDNAAANTRIVGTPVVTTLAEDDAAWNVACSADTTNGALTITVTGNNETTIRWVGTIILTQVGG